jgi:hypothetical protein
MKYDKDISNCEELGLDSIVVSLLNSRKMMMMMKMMMNMTMRMVMAVAAAAAKAFAVAATMGNSDTSRTTTCIVYY